MKRGSKIMGGLTRFCGRVRHVFSQSAVFAWLGTRASSLERLYRSGAFAGLSDRELGQDTWQFRRRRWFMHTFESSAVFCFLQRIGKLLFTASIGSYGCFAFVYGGVSSVLALLEGRYSYSVFFFGAGLLFLSVSVIRSKQSLQTLLQSSLFFGWLLFDLCRLPPPVQTDEEKGHQRMWQASILAIVLAILSRGIRPSILLVGILLAVLLALPLLSPELGVCMLLLMLPFFNLLPHPTLLLLLFAGLVGISWLARLLCGRRRMRFGAVDLSVLLLALQYLAAGWIGYGGRASFFSGGAMAIAILIWFPTVNLLLASEWRQKAAVAVCLSASIASLAGILQYVLGKSELRWIDAERFSDIGGRVTSFFQNPNVLAMFLVLTLPLSWCLIGRKNATLFEKSIGVAALLCGGLCLILTWCRGSWLAILFAVLFFFLLYSKGSNAWLLSLLLPVGALLSYLPSSVRNRFSSISSLTESSIRYRIYTWKGVLQMLLEHPFGIGAGHSAFSAVYPRYAVSGTETVLHAHNLLLRIFCELGLFGCVTFLLFFLFLLLRLLENLRRLPCGIARLEMLSCFCALSGALVMGIFDDIWYHFGLTALFFIVSAWFSTIEKWEENEDRGI